MPARAGDSGLAGMPFTLTTAAVPAISGAARFARPLSGKITPWSAWRVTGWSRDFLQFAASAAIALGFNLKLLRGVQGEWEGVLKAYSPMNAALHMQGLAAVMAGQFAWHLTRGL